MIPVPEFVESETNDYNCLFDASDELKADIDDEIASEVDDPPMPEKTTPVSGAGSGIVTISQQILVGKVHPNDREVRRMQDHKRGEVDAKREQLHVAPDCVKLRRTTSLKARGLQRMPSF
ncbi:hypothetical protein AM587_10000762 [Phytophthora nicotianae]|uniref:Uncharacterized protein n=1 Tax=Phytophthora nicotianae TaxID=4792 RepID=A0A0W8CST4_PHYNI|nr:hypothetical protein AM587_10000341 [Phytophthora nicotianae]KUF87080.1 hypothetical protein AM587_10000762 [Phytophthora nicotianae]